MTQAVTSLHHSLAEGSSKKEWGKWIESRTVEAIILFLLFCDIMLVLTETGIDQHIICVEGVRVQKEHGEVAQLGVPLKFSSTFGMSLLEDKSAVTSLMDSTGHRGQRLRARGAGGGLVPSTPLGLPARWGSHLGPHNDTEGHYGLLPNDKLIKTHASVQDPSPEEGHEAHAEGAHAEGHVHEAHAEGAHGGHEAHAEGGHGHGHEHHGGALVCEDRHGHHAEHISHICHLCSIGILVIFTIEIGIKYWVHPVAFRANFWYMLDAFVVITSLILDVGIMWLEEQARDHDARAMQYIEIGLLTLRLWRVVRIGHGIVEVAHEEMEKQKELEKKVDGLRTENRGLRDVLQRRGLAAEAPPRTEEEEEG